MKYELRITYKTQFLNLFRRIFKIHFFESLIQARTIRNSESIYKRLVAPNYLYTKGSIRTIADNGITLKLDLSEVVDHFVYYFGIRDSGLFSCSKFP